MGFKNIKGEFNRTGLIADFISGKYVGNSAKKVFGKFAFGATGGSVTEPGNGYKYHFFTSLGDFVVSGSENVEYLVVAGGGGGGPGGSAEGQGGGGAGGFRTGTLPVSAGSYPITIGSGGAAYTNGSSSNFGSITSTGGGRGAAHAQPAGAGSGGSGGGGGYTGKPAGAGNTPPVSPPQGNPGSNYIPGPQYAGGGGGGAGTSASTKDGGLGLSAFSADTGIPASYGAPGPTPGRWFAGGGGGGVYTNPKQPTAGGRGGGSGGPYAGGGNGGSASGPGNGTNGSNGQTNTGGGGGGNGFLTAAYAGGSGIVIIRYPT